MKIYLITNTINNHRYVGKTKHALKFRLNRHWVNRNSGRYLSNALLKYGKAAFQISLLEETSQELADEREKFWISALSPEYNMTKGGEGGNTSMFIDYQTHSNRMKGNGNPRFGIKLTDEFKQKLSASHNKDLHRSQTMSAIKEGRHNSQIIEQCIYCGKKANLPNVKRWHNDNCKQKH
jgi:group I intron endonuclease